MPIYSVELGTVQTLEFFLMDLVLAESVGLKALGILIYYFFVFDSALVSVWDLAFIVIDVHVFNYLHCEKHFNTCLF